MCTALSLPLGPVHYFGRNLDLDCGFGQSPVITPRGRMLRFHAAGESTCHEAFIGMARVVNGYALYAEATNESGLSIAGLNFPSNACYSPDARGGKTEIAPYELIPYVMATAHSVAQAREIFSHAVIVDKSFSPAMPNAPLHWIVADSSESLVVESRADGLHVFDNPYGVLTNNPPFEFHRDNVRLYGSLTADWPTVGFDSTLDLTPAGVGYGSVGLPGDLSPASRFVRATFMAAAARAGKLDQITGDEGQRVAQFFHVLESVRMVRGSTRNEHGVDEYTVYTTCMNTVDRVFYYTTSTNHRITAIALDCDGIDGEDFIVFPLNERQDFFVQSP